MRLKHLIQTRVVNPVMLLKELEMAMTCEEILLKGLAVVRRELSVTGLVKFMQQFSEGSGDYTLGRKNSLSSLSIYSRASQTNNHQTQTVEI